MVFDSNIRIDNKNYNLALKNIKSKQKRYGVKNAICLLCSKNQNYDITEFANILKDYDGLIPAIELRKKTSLKTLKNISNKKTLHISGFFYYVSSIFLFSRIIDM